VPPGGEGFECPAPGCTSVFDTAEEALEHGATHGLSGEREVDAEGKSCCLWQGCGKKIKVDVRKLNPDFRKVRIHEALHVKGPKPREAFICPECDEAHATAAAAWACAATHGVEENPKKCLWAGCGRVFAEPSKYREHEPVRAPATRAHLSVPSRAAPPAPRAPSPPARVASLGLPSHAPTPAARRRCTRASGRTTAPRATRASSVRVRPPRRATPHVPRANETPHPDTPALGRARDALLQGHRRVQVRLDAQGEPRREELHQAQGALQPRRGARAAGLSRPAWRPADGCRPRTSTSDGRGTRRHAPASSARTARGARTTRGV